MANGGYLREVGGATRSSERDREIAAALDIRIGRDAGEKWPVSGPATDNGWPAEPVREMKALLTRAVGATTVALNRMVTPCLQSDGMAALSDVVPSE